MIITIAFFAQWKCSLLCMQWCSFMDGNAGECCSPTFLCGRAHFPLFL